MNCNKRLPALPSSTKQPSALRRFVSQRGQGMTEYIIIVALIAVAAIAVYQIFGQVVRSQTAAIANEVGGVDGTASQAEARSAGTAASTQRGKKGLDNYTGAAALGAGGGAAN